MAILTVKDSARTANAVTFVAVAAGGDSFVNTGKEMIIIENAHATLPRTLTIVTEQLVDGLAVADRTVVIGALSTHWLGPWPKGTYNDVDNEVNLTYSDSGADLTIAIVRVIG